MPLLRTHGLDLIRIVVFQVKDTQWEGGVRGVGVVWSPHINKPGRVAKHLMHMQDWLPTLLHAVNSTPPPHLDGVNVWPCITSDAPAPYDQLLINIDNDRSISAVRKNEWKLVKGKNTHLII